MLKAEQNVRGVAPGASWRADRLHRFDWVSVFILVALHSLGCQERPAPKKQQPAVVSSVQCPTGYSIDPPRSVLEPGIRAFRDHDYVEAQRVFRSLSSDYPLSATSRVWLGDAILFDRDRSADDAARAAAPSYEQAAALHAQGCKLPRRPRYYLLMGEAYLALRLAKADGVFRKPWLDRAMEPLDAAVVEFPTSAEVPYTRARAECALAQVGLSADGPADPSRYERQHVEACLEQFRQALAISLKQERPRFLRTHRSAQDWIVRSRTQSEFAPLRATSRYEQIVNDTVSSSPQRL